uniref:Uncharacterized protein n=1 Tax=Mycena chlorophos TaxID=658473 RepID=A0ABQ0LS29_MYCCL|nr:predicted protein [Mycena chlorophos]
MDLDALRVPPEIRNYAKIEDENVLLRLEKWKNKALDTLAKLQTRVEELAKLALKEQADVITAVAPLSAEADWVPEETRSKANEILDSAFPDPALALVTHILQHNVRPIFRTNAHPSVNLDTGRKLPRPAGGPFASQDFYDAQGWKDQPGAWMVVFWCVKNIPSGGYEEIWHLVIPPVMTLLDDYEPQYKLCGLKIAIAMLDHVPGSLLKRTGVDSLFSGALGRAILVLDAPETPILLPSTVSASLQLIKLTTEEESAERFNQLCALLGDSIVGSVWMYSSNRPDALLASIVALPPVFKMLRVGCARYLKVLVAQLVFPLAPLEYQHTTLELQLASLRALSALFDACPQRIRHWSGTILNAVARCWVGVVENPQGKHELRTELQNVCRSLAVVCPELLQTEYPQVTALDEKIFTQLFTSRI